MRDGLCSVCLRTPPSLCLLLSPSPPPSVPLSLCPCLVKISSGGWNRTNGLLVQGQASLPAATTPDRSVSTTNMSVDGSREAAGAGIEPAASWFKARRHYQQRLPRTIKSALRESNPLCQLGRLEPLPVGQGHVCDPGGRGESRTHKAHRSTAFEAAAVANRLALPFLKAPVGGVEPPIFGLTGRRLTVWPHRNSPGVRGQGSGVRSQDQSKVLTPDSCPLTSQDGWI